MARGSQTFEFEFDLCDRIPIQCVALMRGGQAYHVNVYWQGSKLDISDYLFDEQYDFITLERHLREQAQVLYDQSKVEE